MFSRRTILGAPLAALAQDNPRWDVPVIDIHLHWRQEAKAFGELKFHAGAYGPELLRACALAADLDVPVLVHFQQVDRYPGEGQWSTGCKQFARLLRNFPNTRFMGHADAFWANSSAG